MIGLNNLPENYMPYERLVVCSNSLIGGGHILAIGDVLPVIVGKGEAPQVWIQALARPNSRIFVGLVDASVAIHPAVSVREEDNTVWVSLKKKLLLRVEQDGDNSATITDLDLRPLGLDVYGDKSVLHAGGNRFSRNSFQGVGVMIGFSG